MKEACSRTSPGPGCDDGGVADLLDAADRDQTYRVTVEQFLYSFQ